MGRVNNRTQGLAQARPAAVSPIHTSTSVTWKLFLLDSQGFQVPKPVTSISLYHSPDQEARKGSPGETLARLLVIFGSNNGYNSPLGGLPDQNPMTPRAPKWEGLVLEMHLQTMKPQSPAVWHPDHLVPLGRPLLHYTSAWLMEAIPGTGP